MNNEFLWDLLMILVVGILAVLFIGLILGLCSAFYKPKKKYIYRIIYKINYTREFICVAENEQQLLKEYKKFLSKQFLLSTPIRIVSIEILGEDGFLYKKEVDEYDK